MGTISLTKLSFGFSLGAAHSGAPTRASRRIRMGPLSLTLCPGRREKIPNHPLTRPAGTLFPNGGEGVKHPPKVSPCARGDFRGAALATVGGEGPGVSGVYFFLDNCPLPGGEIHLN